MGNLRNLILRTRGKNYNVHKSIFLNCLHDAFRTQRRLNIFFFVFDAYTIFLFYNTVLLWKKHTKALSHTTTVELFGCARKIERSAKDI